MSQENHATPPEKGPVASKFSAGGVALQVASWKVLWYRGMLQLHCRLSRCSGALRYLVALQNQYHGTSLSVNDVHAIL